ncbi:hypothetical protein ACUND2_22590 [Serratia sp. IR-2025]
MNIKVLLGMSEDATPEIIVQVLIDGVPAMHPEVITPEVMSVVSHKILAQGGKGVGNLINQDGSLGDRIKFTASKVETI